jgi:hypothetical protein
MGPGSCRLIIIVALCFLLAPDWLNAATCPPEGLSVEQMLELRHSGFEVRDENERNEIATMLLACVGHPDPDIRDGVVYSALAAWMRGRLLTPETIDVLYHGLKRQIEATDDPSGFRRPFAVLVLSEVARTDRVDPSFSQVRRDELVALAASYIGGISDHRGFVDGEGWRHGVAHASDLVLQLVLNPEIGPEQIERLVGALATQISPDGNVAYIHGEPERLARAVYYAYIRNVVGGDFWQDWFNRLSDPEPLQNWGAAYQSEAGLAQRHNTLSFLRALYLMAGAGRESAPSLTKLVEGAIGALNGG